MIRLKIQLRPLFCLLVTTTLLVSSLQAAQTNGLIPSVVNSDPYDGSNSFADKAYLAARYGSSFKRYNAARWANMGHQRPDFQGFWALLHFTRGTSTKSQSAPSQTPWKLRSYETVLTTIGINDMKDKEQAVAAIQAKHDTEIIAIKGVVSVGIGLSRDGQPCLKIGTSGSTEGIFEKLPDATKDICVEIEQVGDIEAQ